MNKPLSEILRTRMRQTSLPIAVIARNAGIVQPVLHRFFKGEQDLTLRTATKLAKYLELDLVPRSG
jgi:plasmid maintenance system antidote protein VapI